MSKDFLAQHHELRQEQTLSSQQIQSLEILLTPLVELQEKLSREILENPLLMTGQHPLEELVGDPISTSKKVSQKADIQRNVLRESETKIGESLKLAASAYEKTSSSYNNFGSDEIAKKRDFAFESLQAPVSAQQQLLEQLRFSDCSEEIKSIAEIIIGSLDDAGYLRSTPADIAMSGCAELGDVERAIKLVQSFDPPGVGAENLRESLLLQLKRSGNKDEKLQEVVKNHLDELGRNKIPQIAKVMGCSTDEIEMLIEKLRHLKPFPLSQMQDITPLYIIPEVVVKKEGGQYIIISNENYIPDLKISDTYLELLNDKNANQETQKYLKEKLSSAKVLIQSLAQRQRTIERIANVIVATQYDFFEKGIHFLRPLTMLEVANKLDLHETTISRAIANKYLKSPRGLHEFKFFFTTGFQSTQGEELSSRSIKEKIRELIAEEDSKKPLSDNKLAILLKSEGLKVARRTVAKYREALGISASNLRKKHSS